MTLEDESMAYNMLFMVYKEATAPNNLAPIFSGYEWWVDLAKGALERADEFEMRLWEDDLEGIKSGQKFGQRILNNETREIVFRGRIVPELKREILTNYLTEEGYIKWFTLILKRNKEHIFASSHYGDETLISVQTQEKVHVVQQWAKNYPIIWRVDVFECEHESER